jgi:hypothetical protein
MSTPAGPNTHIYVNGYELTTFLRNAKVTHSLDSVDDTTYGKTAHTHAATLRDGMMTAEGNYAGAAGEVDERLNAAMIAGSAAIPSVILFNGSAAGSLGRGFLATDTGYDINAPVDGIVAISATLQGSGGVDRVTVLHAPTAEVTADDGPAVDNVDPTTGGLVGYLQVLAIAGGNCTVKVQDSDDNISYADLITFGVVSVANVAERAAALGTVERYTRWSISGTFTSVTFLLAVGRG